MSKSVRYFLTPAIFITGLTFLGWLDAFHLSLAAIILLLSGTVGCLSRIRPPRHQLRRNKLHRGMDDSSVIVSDRSMGFRQELARVIIRGCLLFAAVIAISYLASVMPGLQAMVLDRDRTAIELKLEALEQARNWSAAADMIEMRLERRTSREWKNVLQLRLYQCLIAAGTACSGKEAKGFFQHARELAERNGLNNDLAATHLDQLNLQNALHYQKGMAAELAQSDSRRQAEIQRLSLQVTDFRQQKTELQARMNSSRGDNQQLTRELVQAQLDLSKTQADQVRGQYDLLVKWGDSLDVANPLRKANYLSAKALAQKHNLDATMAKARLFDLERTLQQNQPAVMPAGVRASLLRTDTTTFSPLAIVDVSVSLPTGETVRELTTKDFRLIARSGPLIPLTVSCLRSPPEYTQLILLFDHSKSTAGPALSAAKSGAIALLKQIQGTAKIKLIAFSSKPSIVSDWTDDLSAASTGLQQLSADGNTALQLALEQAIVDLRSRNGPKAIVLFTDGRDTVGGPMLNELVDRSRQAGITIHAIALETAELDKEFLMQITQETGGTLHTASKISELALHFQNTAQGLNRIFYRLVFTNLSADQPGEIVIGGMNAVHVGGKAIQATQ